MTGATHGATLPVLYKYIPRHTFNLLTGTVGSAHLAILVWGPHSLLMSAICGGVFLTSLIYHGAHTIGKERWANEVFMKYDVGCVMIGGCIITIQSAVHGITSLCYTLGYLGVASGLWLLSFGVLKGLPYNVIGSALHGIGWAMHVRLAQQLYGVP